MSTNNFRCYIAGSESLLIHCADALLQGGHVICGIISDTPQIVEWAQTRSIRVLGPGKQLLADITENFDYFFSITNLSIIPKEVIAKAACGGVNFHDGPLPRYAGLYATAWALLNRETSHGVTWHVMTDAVDEGDILCQEHFELRGDETSFGLNTRCYEAAIESFAELISSLRDKTASPRKQDLTERTYFALSQRPPGAATLDFSQSAEQLDALVRALNFGPVFNPLALPKFVVGDELVTVSESVVVEGQGSPGTVVHIADDQLVVATSSGAVSLRGLRSPLGLPYTAVDLAARHKLRAGTILAPLSADALARVSDVNLALCRYESFWIQRLERLRFAELPIVDGKTDSHREFASAPLQRSEVRSSLPSDEFVTVFAEYIGRLCNVEEFDFAYRDGQTAEAISGAEEYFANYVPMHAAIAMSDDHVAVRETMSAELKRVRKRGSYAVDVVARTPSLRAEPLRCSQELMRLVVAVVDDVETFRPPAEATLVVVVATDGTRCVWHYDTQKLSENRVEAMQRQFLTLLAGVGAHPTLPLCEQSILSEAELQKILIEWNDVRGDYPRKICVHTLVEQQVLRTPDAPAIVHQHETITYRELDTRANQLAHYLMGLGVGPDILVGICVARSIDMMVAALGVMKAGGAYVPIDPRYPKGRIALMIEDSKVPVLISQQALIDRVPAHEGTTVFIDSEWQRICECSSEVPKSIVNSRNLAYTIYTSGSTGRPKGVMVEHRNVVSFFGGMDERIGFSEGDTPGAWLSVTSMSFDISVLELFWTLTRGFKVVLHEDQADGVASVAARQRHADRKIDFSLMYFASDEGENESSADKYRLLLEGAKFGDQNGFSAVWTPERHFHAFGGLYPNPSVAAAALATITSKIGLRAASVVAPLHHPIRIAEEWSLVDNLSNGRVGISFASGWQPNDFIIRDPEKFEQRKEVMFENIAAVRSLWRGETFTATSPLGKKIQVMTLPRPVQKELPVWITAASNPETFRAGGEIGANVLTHLLGQTIEEVGEKIKVYREARAKGGHEGPGNVTMMLHTFVGPDEDVVKDTVREPMKAYLRSALQLVKAAAWTFPTFKERADATGKTPAEVFEEEDLSSEDLEAVLEHAFNRYYETSGLFGTPSSCLAMIDDLKGIGVDDVGCLLDYGVPSATVLTHLKFLGELKTHVTREVVGFAEEYSLAAQVARHDITHIQCTPSQMSMVLASDESRAALRGLQKIMIGGEAFPAALAEELRAATDGDILNMYGPTETTIWSSTQSVVGDGGAVSIGRPIANTQMYILDGRRRPVPVSVAGELYIAGDGVVRGYYQRPELTDERFVPNPFVEEEGARMYRTGDLARYRDDGTIEFLGRVDFQVKLRGYRIELGEIEAHLGRHDDVREGVVVAREDVPGDKRLVAYLVGESGKNIDVSELRTQLRGQLPEFMVPTHMVQLEGFPMTPNGKLDRNALPSPDKVAERTLTEYVAPSGDLEQKIAEVWGSILNVEGVGVDDNFFDLGGHSLLTVQMHRALKKVVEKPFSLTDLFRFPTIRSLVSFLSGEDSSDTMKKSKDRANARKNARSMRAGARRPRANPGRK